MQKLLQKIPTFAVLTRKRRPLRFSDLSRNGGIIREWSSPARMEYQSLRPWENGSTIRKTRAFKKRSKGNQASAIQFFRNQTGISSLPFSFRLKMTRGRS